MGCVEHCRGTWRKTAEKITKLKDKEVFAAIGWLAREGKISIATDPEDEKEFIISLVQDC